uniref:Sec1 family domain-containing protein 1 n=1 Tax=Meloidogyne javanica TaxID=6303 RepID=A0A915LZG0_MELJA
METLRSRQTAALKQLLNLNQPFTQSLAVEPTWKLLIFDGYGQDIISPLLNVKQLREAGVTLHMHLNSQRETLPDVPAVYFVSPTESNIQIICNDLRKSMYDSYYFNMIYPLPRPLLEDLALSAVEGGIVQQVQKVTDQFLAFISLEDDLFMLSRYSQTSPYSFFALNNPSASDESMNKIISSIANGLFSICITLGVVPIIKCPKNNAAERVAEKLDQKIRDNLRDARNNLFTQENVRASHLNIHRPVLVIADRSLDLSTMLHHTWTYQAMIADILDMDLNRIRMKDKNGRQKDYEFSNEDKLFNSYKGSAFPLVAEAIQEDLEAYRKNEEEIRRLKDSMGIEGSTIIENESDFLLDSATNKLSSAVGSLPELLEKKRLIDLHTNVATALLDNIKSRKLDILYETEEKLLTGQDLPLMECLRECSTNEDALRFVLISACSKNLSTTEQREILAHFEEKGISPDALNFVRQLRSFSNVGGHTELHLGAGTKTVGMFSKLLNQSSKFVMEGVKNLVPKKHSLPLTKMIEQLTEVKVGGGMQSVTGLTVGGSSNALDGADEFRVFDPKLTQGSIKDGLRSTYPVVDVIVFVVGGGNYVEYQNVIEWAKTKPSMQRITYGCTEMVSPKCFVEQLSHLGEKSRGGGI